METELIDNIRNPYDSKGQISGVRQDVDGEVSWVSVKEEGLVYWRTERKVPS